MQLVGICGLDSKLLDYIETIKINFSEVCMCLHVHDFEKLEIREELKQRNISFILGADPADANSLCRMREIFDYYDYVASTVMGSHILYAAFCGCKVSLLRNHLHIYTKNAFINHVTIQSIPGHEARMLDNFNNFVNLESRFPRLFVEHPLESIQMTEWANDEIGFSNLISKDRLLSVLGWSLSSKVKALLRAVYFRADRLFGRSIFSSTTH